MANIEDLRKQLEDLRIIDEEAYKAALKNLKAQKELKAQLDQGKISLEEYNKAVDSSTEKLNENEKQILDTQKALHEATKAQEALNKATGLLTAGYDKLTSTFDAFTGMQTSSLKGTMDQVVAIRDLSFRIQGLSVDIRRQTGFANRHTKTFMGLRNEFLNVGLTSEDVSKSIISLSRNFSAFDAMAAENRKNLVSLSKDFAILGVDFETFSAAQERMRYSFGLTSDAAIAATKLDFNVDLGGDITFGNQSNDTVAFTGPVTVGGDLTVNGSVTSINSTTINITSSFVFEGPADDHETTLHAGSPSQDITVYLPQYSSSAGAHSAYLPVMADAPTAASALVTAAEFALLDGGSSIGTDALVAADGFMHNDNGTMKQTQVVKIAELAFSMLSGDATANSAGALTIANDAVEQAMIADDAVGADQLAANAVVNASVVDGSIKADKLDIDGSTDIGEDLVNADLFIVDNGAGGTNRKCTMERLKTFIGSGTAAVNVKADGDTLAVGVNYFADMSSDGEDVVTLPASAGMTVGESVKVKAPSDASAARYITINKAGSQTIDGQTSIRLESPFAAVELVYVAADTWRVF